jgi:hypothetical protein
MSTREERGTAPRSRSRGVPLIVAIAAGAVGGAVISIEAGGQARRPPPTRSQDDGAGRIERRPQPSSPVLGSLRDDLSRMQQRVQQLENPEAAGAPPAPPPESQSARVHHERHDRAIREHDAEPIDRAWGPQTTGVVRTDIEKLAPGGQFQLMNVDCRTATCAAVVQWPSREAAIAGYRWLLQFPLRANCERTIVLPEPSAGAGDVQATLLLDCNTWRAEGAQLLQEDSMPPLPVASLATPASPAPP